MISLSARILCLCVLFYFIEAKERDNYETIKLATSAGYPIEEHQVTSSDGYFLNMHRIPNPGNPIVLLMHGLLSSSSIFLLMGKDLSLAYQLHNDGYDVWLGNARGSKYSKKHKIYSDKSIKYWKFSFHEIGINDYPVMIDYILQNTNLTNLNFIGHSQGCTCFLAMATMLPEYGAKIDHALFMAPISKWSQSLENAKLMDWFSGQVEYFADVLGVSHQFNVEDPWYSRLARQFCYFHEKNMHFFCRKFLPMITGFERNVTVPDIFKNGLAKVPKGATIHELENYIQIYKSGKLQSFDYESDGNLEVYKQTEPLVYDLSKIDATITIYYGQNDQLAPYEDVQLLSSELMHVSEMYEVQDPNFGHNDFLWNPNVKPVYEHMLMTLLTIPKKRLHIEKSISRRMVKAEKTKHIGESAYGHKDLAAKPSK